MNIFQNFLLKYILKKSLLIQMNFMKEKEQCYQIVIEELENGLLSIAVPIYNRDDEIIGAMNIATHLSYKNTKMIRETILPLLLEASKKTSKSIKLLQQY